MSTMSSYFEYRLMTLCGIPEITLLGTADGPQELLRPESRRASSAQRPGLRPVCAAKTRFVLPSDK